MGNPKPKVFPDRMLPVPGEIPVDISARIFLDAKQFGPIDPERTVLDCLMELSRAIREGRGIIRRVVIKGYSWVKIEVVEPEPEPKG